MKSRTFAGALALVALGVPVLAQQQPPVTAPAPKPSAPAPQAVQPPRPFPEGAKIPYVDVSDGSVGAADGARPRESGLRLGNRTVSGWGDGRVRGVSWERVEHATLRFGVPIV